jgi:hypothetical protein
MATPKSPTAIVEHLGLKIKNVQHLELKIDNVQQQSNC